MSYKKASKESNLTRTQEEIVFTLYMLDSTRYRNRHDGITPQFYSGAAIAIVLGGKWSTYRTRLLNSLIDLNWIEVQRVSRLRYYRLKNESYDWVDNLLFEASNGRTRLGQLVGQMDFFAEK